MSALEAERKPPAPRRPRDAASLVIHRQRRGHHEVLMGRRGGRDKFRPGVYVFPGGGLEAADYRVQPLESLDQRWTAHLGVAGSERKANALAMAAVREAFEEAGLIYGDTGDVGKVAHPSWQQFRALERAPDLAALDYLGRAITPSFRPIRFHARFFSIPAERLEGELGGDGELEDLRWVRLDRTGELEMMQVQEMVLETLAARLAGKHAPPRRLFYAWGRINVEET